MYQVTFGRFQFTKCGFKNLHKVVYIFEDVRNGHILAESLMNILIACCLVVSDSESEETNFRPESEKTNFRQHVCDKNNFI